MNNIKKVFKIIVMIFVLIVYVFIKMDTNVTEATLVSCVDGDTAVFEIDGNREKVRFLAIDTLEVNESMGIEASKYVCKALNNASKITLEFEGNAYKDKYDRVLAWVFVDDELIQEDLISKGLAQVKYIYDDYKYTNQLFDLQEKAKSEKIGLWSEKYE